MRTNTTVMSALTIIGMAAHAPAFAQDLTADLAVRNTDDLRSALQTRYDAALTATRDNGTIAANDPRYVWASEAKVQCAMALGYLKSNTRDEPSISKCDYAYGQMAVVPQMPVAVIPPPPRAVAAPPPPAICTDQQPDIVFFDFDSDLPTDGASQTIDFVAGNAERCGWGSFRVVGHTDRAGSNLYNEGLSMRRAHAIADLMVGKGIERGAMTITAEGETNPRVPTADGIRSPQNRRVEITVSK